MLGKVLRLAKLIRRNNIHEYLFNVPVKIAGGEIYSVNERIIELPIIQRYLADLPIGKRILEFGCTRSWLSMTMSAMGYHVIGADLRDYDVKHPNFEFHKGEIQKLQIDPVDCIVSVSTIEHVGIGAYKEQADDTALTEVLNKLHQLLNTEGWLLLTVPVGIPRQDNFQRIFSPEGLKSLLISHNFLIENVEYFTRSDEATWHRVDENELQEGVYSSGVSSVACLKCVRN